MKKQLKKQMPAEQHTGKTKILKWITVGLAAAIICLWISWFTCDCIFVANGIKVLSFEIGTPIPWEWNQQLFQIQETQAIVLLSMLGGLIGLLLANMVVFGLYMRNNLKHNMYQLIATSAAFIAIIICVIKAGQMMINKKYVIDINVTVESLLPFSISSSFNVYHLDYLKWMSIPPGAVIFIGIILLQSFRKFDGETLIRDSNLLIIVYAILTVALFAPFVLKFGWNDPAAQGLDIIEGSITWSHITAQCITSPIGVFAGMLMVLLVVRFIGVIFAYNNRWIEKKRHMIIFTIIGFFVIAAFIVSHVNPVDFEKLILDYQSMKLGGLLVVLAEAVTCLAAGVYCSISHLNYLKRAA